MAGPVTREENYRDSYRDRSEKAGRMLEIQRMTLKHERRLLKMKREGVEIK